LTILVVIVSTVPGGTPGRSNAFTRSITNCRFGTDSVIVYGPTPGGGSWVMFLNGVSPGTRPAKFMASTFEKVPSGSASLIVISPVPSSVSIPAMSPSGLPAST
jgi:hypothetical protein